MKKIILITGVIILVMIWLLSGKKDGNLVGPTPTPAPTPIPTPNAPKTFQFDSSTDLKVELDKVNPQILDTDFQ